MKNGKALGPSGKTSDLIKAAGEVVVRELARILYSISKPERKRKHQKSGKKLPTVMVNKGNGDNSKVAITKE